MVIEQGNVCLKVDPSGSLEARLNDGRLVHPVQEENLLK
jgi:hypothetical protein